jgi:hypothetical protein
VNIGLLALLSVITGVLFVFPSLGPTAYQLFLFTAGAVIGATPRLYGPRHWPVLRLSCVPAQQNSDAFRLGEYASLTGGW